MMLIISDKKVFARIFIIDGLSTRLKSARKPKIYKHWTVEHVIIVYLCLYRGRLVCLLSRNGGLEPKRQTQF